MGTYFNINGKLVSTDKPLVMAIINATPDSFYETSRNITSDEIAARVKQAVAEGADILDIGGCSTRPCSTPVDMETEWQRVEKALTTVRHICPDAVLSLDTFRGEIARRATELFGSIIINDISGLADESMADIVADAGVPYILTYNQPSEKSGETYLAEMIDYLLRKTDILQRAGVKDIIIDPGFGFDKTYEQNWMILKDLHCLQVLEKPVLVGISRKSMIQKALGCNADNALNGTTAAHMVALTEGADILRVHDVKEAKETILIHAVCRQRK